MSDTLYFYRVRYIDRHKGPVRTTTVWARDRRHAISLKTGDGRRVVSCARVSNVRRTP